MKRQILFRGFGVSSNEWVEGDLIHGVGSKSGNMYILPNRINLAYVKNCHPLDGVKVHPDSVGQFTNLIDTTQSNIFEGMIVRVGAGFEGIVKFKCGSFIIEHESGKFYFMNELVSHLSFTITGNTFNPDHV
jgi:hypothetical protein